MAVSVRFDGGVGELSRLDGERLHFVAAKAFAPGQPIALKLEVEGPVLPVETRSMGSKRREDGSFDVTTRIVTMSDANRERILAALAVED